MKEVEKLLKLGLMVEERVSKGSYKKYLICKPKSDLKKLTKDNSNDYGYYFITLDNPIELEDASSNLYFIDDKWIFEVWEYAPGPGTDDFVCEFNHLHLAIDAIINFYFGEPTLIQDWLFPLHRHPELHFKLIDSVINNAVKVTKAEFEQISSQLWEQVKGDWPFRAWDKALIGDFLKISHTFDKSIFLMIRRDLQQSFLVCD